MRAKTRAIALASMATAVGLVAAACSTGPSSTATSSASAISVRGCTPENPLIGTTTNEVCGGNVLDAISAKLVHYNSDTAAPELDIAESIETSDATNFTVKLKANYKFHDGTVVKAKNFVDAWNWGAACSNAQLNSYFFAPIAGFTDPKGEGCSTADTLSGLKVVDDTTFTITTSAPTSNLPVRLGYTAFMPQPDAFFADTSEGKKTFGNAPVGAGPFKLTSKTDTEMVLEKFADYAGKNTGSVDKVTFKIYNDTNAAYNDVVANNLDLTDVIPADQLVGDAWKSDLDGRNGTRETGIIQVITFSPKDDNLKSIEMRQALSMGFDRELVTKQIFNGARTPATGWVSPVVDGYKAGACGDNCTFDAAKAKTLYEKAGGYKGTMPIYVNGDGGHKPWAEAVCNQWKNNLGLNCTVEATPDFATLRKGINARELKGLYRGGWQMDYPSIENFLAPIYGTGAGSNDGDYSSAKFDGLLKEAAAAADPAAANAKYQEAEAQLAVDFPSIPMWYGKTIAGWSENVENVKITPFGTIDLLSVTKKA